MKVIYKAPGCAPEPRDIPNALEELQATVGGYIEAIYPYEDRVAIVCDEEAKLKADSRWNRMIPECRDVIKGTFFICGLGEEDFDDLSPELTAKYKERFWNIEQFIQTERGLLPIVLNEQ